MSISVTSVADFDRHIKAGPVVVDFYATWCGPCMNFAPTFEGLAKSNPKVTFLKVNVDEMKDLAGRYSVSSLPTFKFFVAGREVKSVSGAGASTKSDILTFCEAHGRTAFDTTEGHRLGGADPVAPTEPGKRPNPWANRGFKPPGNAHQ
jgi:thioredoxin 1